MSSHVREGCVVTIDGPAGSGKSTTAREVARRLGFRHQRLMKAVQLRHEWLSIRLLTGEISTLHGEAGKYGAGLDAVDAVVEDTDGVGYPPLDAEVRLARGELLSKVGRYDEAEQDLEDGFFLADDSDHD